MNKNKNPKDKIVNETKVSDVISARENFTKRLEKEWGKTVKIPANSKIEFRSIVPFKELIEQNYQAIRARGLITDETDFFDFMEKLEEETTELAHEYNIDVNVMSDHKVSKEFEGELMDCISILLNMARHYNINVIEGLKNNVIKNLNRAKNETKS